MAAEAPHVLIVDDELYVLDVLQRHLSEYEFVVDLAASGDEAKRRLEESPPDVVLLDLHMPGIDGFQVLDFCRQKGLDTEVVFMSGQATVESVAAAVGAGAFDLLLKPFELARVSRVLRSACEKRRLERKNRELLGVLRSSNARLEKMVSEKTKTLEAALANLQSLESMKRKFLCLVGHVLRTPLAGIIGALEFIVQTARLDPDEKDLLAQTLEEAWRLKEITEDVLLVTRLSSDSENSVPQDLPVHRMVDACLERLAEEIERKGLKVLNLVPLGVVLATDPHVRDAFARLLANAVRYTDEGTIQIELELGETEALLRVCDTGRGIRPDEIEHLVSPFATAEDVVNISYHAGLGLAVASAVMEKVGGRLWLESDGLGCGTTAVLAVPLSPVPPVDRPPQPPAAGTRTSSRISRPMRAPGP